VSIAPAAPGDTRSKVLVCGCLLAEFVGLNPAGTWLSVSYEYCVLSGRGLCQASPWYRGVLPSVHVVECDQVQQ